MNFLLDTNILSEAQRPQPDLRVMDWLGMTDEDRIFISVISIAEIRRGIELLPASRRKEMLADWLDNDLPPRFEGRMLLVDKAVNDQWGHVMAAAKKAGIGLQPMDAFFAATALAHNLVLVTRNTKDFAATGVRLLNPWDVA